MAGGGTGTVMHSTTIPHAWSTPPALEASSCVYVLQLRGSSAEAAAYYVGETDALRQRLAQHRQRFLGCGVAPPMFDECHCIVVPVSQSAARHCMHGLSSLTSTPPSPLHALVRCFAHPLCLLCHIA